MFGYVKPVIPELLVKEHEFYRATYCGICRAMGKYTGELSRLSLTYDSVFLALIRMAYMPSEELGASMRRCVLHPVKSRCMLNDNSAIEYTARAFSILTYYKMRDDLTDERFSRRLLCNLSRPVLSAAKRSAALPELEDLVRDRLNRITELEAAGEPSADTPATLFGELLGEIFSGGLSADARLVTYQCGYHLGRFIYCADAAEDYESDARLGRYNPYCIQYGGKPLSDENRQTVRNALMLECKGIEGAVNLIPFGDKITVENIVRNIIYLGLPKRIEFLDKSTTDKEREE